MSIMIGGNINNFPQSARYNDERLQRNDYRLSFPDMREANISGVNHRWPRSSFQGQSNFASLAPIWESRHQDWEANTMYSYSGTHVRKQITGVTLFANGAPCSGVTVILFNTANNAVVDTQVSDAGGNYTLTDPNNTTNFVVAYEASSPDIAGTSKNNLVGV